MEEKKRMPLIEIFLGELIVFMSIWFLDQDIARLFTLLVPVLFAGTLVVALISELLERSRVPRIFFYILGVTIVAPLVAAGLMIYIGGMSAEFGGVLFE